MGKKCQICKKKCTGDIIKSDGGDYFHIDCFVCKTCKRPLSEVGFYTITDGSNGSSYVCPEHYHNVTSPLTIRAEMPKVYKQSELTTPSLGSPFVAENTCASCGDHLHNGQVLLALDQSWHVWCFKCSECAAVLQGEYMAHEGKPLCLRDYNLKYGVKCYECEKFIAGRVLEAGGYKFHPTCARCSRCGNHFGDGQEMYMQGNEIWHPQCEHYRTTENLKTANGKNREASHLASPPQPAQFHTPQAPIKIRKSRMSMLKTGMQRLTEDLDKNQPRAKSPHMDNEEPIEEDFPAPPYPYAVEELKRRLSSSSVENDDDEEELYADANRVDEEKVKKNVEALDNIDKDSSIAHVIKQIWRRVKKATTSTALGP
uniref:LIM zinc-binding domain-containing protein n=1 Tax=Ditylenchus dipsaci TaxID=166011 RepID=A0A915DJK8_9BILA